MHFTENLKNVTITNFEITDGTVSVGEISKVEMHSNSNLEDTNPATAITDTTTLSGRYFKVSINPNEDINGMYAFKILAGSMIDDAGNLFQTSSNDIFNNISINTERAPTVDSLSVVDVLITPKSGDFEINVTFSEEVNNVDIGDFRLVSKGASTSTAPTFGTIVVQKHSDSNFNDTSPTTTDTTTTQLSGTYFKVIVSPQDDLMTDDGVTDYEFQVIDDTANSSSIEDGASNALETSTLTGIRRAIADISIDTTHPKTESISLETTGTQITTFDVNVIFNESVNNVDIGNFEFTDGTVSVGEITKVEVHSDSDLDDTNPDTTTTDTTTLSGRYFKVSVSPYDDIDDTYTFKVLPTSITDQVGSTFQTSTDDDTLDIDVDTIHPTTSQISTDSTERSKPFFVDVTFSENMINVINSTFDFAGTVESVTVYDSSFTSAGDSTDTSASLSGRYFRVLITPNSNISGNTYAFTVSPSLSTTDESGNTFQASTDDDTLDIYVDTLYPTISQISTDSATKTAAFDVNVSFSESVNNVSIGSFNFSIEGLGFKTHVGEITKVEMHSDTNFNDDSIQSSTTDATTLLSGRYFKVSVNPNEDISDTYVFRISPLYITDDLGNTLQIFLEDKLKT